MNAVTMQPKFPLFRGLRFLLVPVLGIAGALFAPSAGAQSIVFTTTTPPATKVNLVDDGSAMNNVYAGTIGISISQYDGVTVSPAAAVVTFCIQLNQDINVPGGPYTFTAEALLSDTLLNTVSARDLTTLYYLFYKGNVASDWSGTAGQTNAEAFQLDCWAIVQDPGNYNLTASNSIFYVTSTGTAVNLAQQWLTEVSGTVVTNGGTNTPVALYSSTEQDLLYTESIQQQLIPFHVAAWPGAFLLGAIGYLRVRKRLQVAA